MDQEAFNREQAAEKGMAAARRFAEWHLGDASWANLIVNAYLDPDASDAALKNEKGS